MTPVQRLKAGETLLTAWSSIPDPIVVDTIAQTSVETVTLDMQHGGHSESSVLNCIQPLLHRGKGAIVRVPVGRFDMASRALDMGADAVIAPMINTIEDARLFANAMKFPPMGER
ncbi:MAG TPA: aldolase/citrate lyase family protein, partial [Rhizobiaceae bacterium]|nr:aldolase/citrate lyase family protein [Rhizobiaceae bacterium]